jgi:hypothetical protein
VFPSDLSSGSNGPPWALAWRNALGSALGVGWALLGNELGLLLGGVGLLLR